MKITIFTSNQPRHLSLIEDLSKIADEVYAVMESSTVFPGEVADFYDKSAVMKEYFSKVMAAEQSVFGQPRFLPKNVRPLVIRIGDLNKLPIETFKIAMNSEKYVVFGASYIKSALIDFLVAKKAYNIHVGVSPYYRGNSCNFWAAYQGNFDYVGATIHLLSKGLDSGDMLFHAFPESADEPFRFGMKAVKAAHRGLVENIKNGNIDRITPVPQNKSLEIKYTKKIDFTDEVAQDYLNHLPSLEKIAKKINQRDLSKFLNPYIYKD